jgi:hypothetical protein
MTVKLCDHRYEITYTFTDVGYGFIEEQAIDDCMRNLTQTHILDLIRNLEVSKVIQDVSIDRCYLCEEAKL